MEHLTGTAVDRLEHLRGDPDRAFPPDTRVLTVWGDRALVRGHEPVSRPLDALGSVDRSALVLLGEHDGARYAARSLHDAEEARAVERETGGELVGLRAATGILPAWATGLLFYGAALHAWHDRSRHCGVCGAATEATHAGHQRRCTAPDCAAVQFPRADPAIITLVRRDDRCLLIHQPNWPEGRFSTLAGFVEPGESLEQAVAREVAEEVGLDVVATEYLASQPWPFPHTVMIGFRTTAGPGDLRMGEEVTDARWFTRAELEEAIAAAALTIPPPFALSRTLIEDWLGEAREGGPGRER